MRAREFIKEQWAPGAIDPNKSVEQHYIGRYTPADQKHIGTYVDTNRDIQQMLNKPDADKILKDPKMSWITDPVNTLDKISQQRTTPFDMTVHRGLEKMPQLDKDNVMTTKGYLSTSTDPEFAKWWAEQKTKERSQPTPRGSKNSANMLHPDYYHTMQIQVPKGTPGFYASDAQSEWVAPRNSKVSVHPEPTIDHKNKTVSWKGQYVSTPPASKTIKSGSIRGGGGNNLDSSDPSSWRAPVEDPFQTAFDPKRVSDQLRHERLKRGH